MAAAMLVVAGPECMLGLMSKPRIHHLFTSPGHDYFGRHGKGSLKHGILSHAVVDLVAGQGIVGDRFFGWKEDYKGQITFIDLALIDDVRRHAGDPDLPAAAFRRNVVVSGIDLHALIGRTFELGGLRFEGTEECRPCYWMDEACGRPGTEELKQGRGGLRCRILDNGQLRLGSVKWVQPPR